MRLISIYEMNTDCSDLTAKGLLRVVLIHDPIHPSFYVKIY